MTIENQKILDYLNENYSDRIKTEKRSSVRENLFMVECNILQMFENLGYEVIVSNGRAINIREKGV